eukprot:TRINITY_DN14644_c0_g1_i1.p1 TRINITY_DN14644_c0_g1~~TRINITY_DN14644_c0_g1_i1.p1  ORF type:complete len:1391 (-),score=439.06 TRINITY_DN14644_c0_g1_i1:79-3657(-)
MWQNNKEYPVHTISRTLASLEVKKILSRLTAENVKPKGRQIAKLTHTHPDVVFHKMLTRSRVYNNEILPIIDTLKYLTQLSLDVLNYSLICFLSNPTTNNESLIWLNNLSQFTGQLFKRYASKIELLPMMQYLVNQLQMQNTDQLVVLKEIIEKSSNLFMHEDIQDEQLLMLDAGGARIRSHTMVLLTPQEPKQRTTSKSIESLAKTLVSSRLVVPIFLLIAHTRATILFEQQETHLKKMGETFDKIHESLLLYNDMVNQFILSNEELATKTKLPYLIDLVQKYHLEPECAFHILRSSLHTLYVDVKRDGEITPSTKRKLMDDVLKILPKHVHYGAEFYCLFWSLSLSDIFVPRAEYEAKIKTLSDSTEVIALQNELKEQESKHRFITKKMEEEKKNWFHCNPSTAKTIGTQFVLEQCILPRCVYSMTDAIFCANFAKLIHTMGCDGFSFPVYFQRIIDSLGSVIFSCTEAEASRYGKFLSVTLTQIKRWKNDSTLFEKECGNSFSRAGEPGFSNFKRLTIVWEEQAQKIFTSFIESGKFIKIRNAIIVLTKLLGVFPSYNKVASAIENCIAPLASERRNDIKVRAESYKGKLEKNKSTLLSDEQYYSDSTATEESKDGKWSDQKSKVEAQKYRPRFKGDTSINVDPKAKEDSVTDKDSLGTKRKRNTTGPALPNKVPRRSKEKDKKERNEKEQNDAPSTLVQGDNVEDVIPSGGDKVIRKVKDKEIDPKANERPREDKNGREEVTRREEPTRREEKNPKEVLKKDDKREEMKKELREEKGNEKNGREERREDVRREEKREEKGNDKPIREEKRDDKGNEKSTREDKQSKDNRGDVQRSEKEPSRDIPTREIGRDVPREVIRDQPRETARDTPREGNNRDVLREVPRDVSREGLRDVPRDTREPSREVSRDLSKSIRDEKEKPKEKPKEREKQTERDETDDRVQEDRQFSNDLIRDDRMYREEVTPRDTQKKNEDWHERSKEEKNREIREREDRIREDTKNREDMRYREDYRTAREDRQSREQRIARDEARNAREDKHNREERTPREEPRSHRDMNREDLRMMRDHREDKMLKEERQREDRSIKEEEFHTEDFKKDREVKREYVSTRENKGNREDRNRREDKGRYIEDKNTSKREYNDYPTWNTSKRFKTSPPSHYPDYSDRERERHPHQHHPQNSLTQNIEEQHPRPKRRF